MFKGKEPRTRSFRTHKIAANTQGSCDFLLDRHERKKSVKNQDDNNRAVTLLFPPKKSRSPNYTRASKVYT